jgi:translation initiation factor IF-3
MDMGKYKYDAQKKANKAKKKQKKIELKEIKLRPVTEVHDYTFKIKNAQKFISKGDKVKFTIKFKGRELQHSHLGNELMDKIKHDMQEIGRVELHPKFDGKQMIMVIQPL